MSSDDKIIRRVYGRTYDLAVSIGETFALEKEMLKLARQEVLDTIERHNSPWVRWVCPKCGWSMHMNDTELGATKPKLGHGCLECDEGKETETKLTSESIDNYNYEGIVKEIKSKKGDEIDG